MGRGVVDFARGIERLSAYARYSGTANPRTNEVWLNWRIGLWVRNLRLKHRSGNLRPEQIEQAKSIGVKFEPPYRDAKPKPAKGSERRDAALLHRLMQLKQYHEQHGHINVKQLDGVEGWPGAGRWIARFRTMYRNGTLSTNVIQAAEALNIKWNVYRKHPQNDVNSEAKILRPFSES